MTPNWQWDNTYARLPATLHAPAVPAAFPAPRLVLLNTALAGELGLDFGGIAEDDIARTFTGQTIPAGCEPLAQAYAGHQYGGFTVLGDGRAILLGEHVGPHGRVDVQLKGAGPTRYSRRGDGLAALGPMLREYIVSEAMHAVGVPTTRSLAVCTTGAPVVRETMLSGAVLTRIAASHIRVGTFEFASAQLDRPTRASLVSYTLNRHAPELLHEAHPALALLKHAIAKQATLIAQWMLAGFVHGVMNTDNVSLAGETIDYGPCAFLDTYDPATVFSSIDEQGRYAYGNQPRVTLWNLARFAESLLPLIDADEQQSVAIATAALNDFPTQYDAAWLAGMRRKLGLRTAETEDLALANGLLEAMQANALDYTNTFRRLANDIPVSLQMWAQQWHARLQREGTGLDAAHATMRQVNPSIIPRNHIVEAALSAANAGDLAPLHALLAAITDPFTDDPKFDAFRSPKPAGTKRYRTFCGT